jgi:hypothetical protein
VDLKVKYEELAALYPKSSAAQRIPLDFLEGADFAAAAERYVPSPLTRVLLSAPMKKSEEPAPESVEGLPQRQQGRLRPPPPSDCNSTPVLLLMSDSTEQRGDAPREWRRGPQLTHGALHWVKCACGAGTYSASCGVGSRRSSPTSPRCVAPPRPRRRRWRRCSRRRRRGSRRTARCASALWRRARRRTRRASCGCSSSSHSSSTRLGTLRLCLSYIRLVVDNGNSTMAEPTNAAEGNGRFGFWHGGDREGRPS